MLNFQQYVKINRGNFGTNANLSRNLLSKNSQGHRNRNDRQKKDRYCDESSD